jgi:hypothetical protein
MYPTTALSMVLALYTPLLPHPTYPQLPSRQVSEICLRAAEDDLWKIQERLQFLGGWKADSVVQVGDLTARVEGTWQRGGWRVQQLVDAEREAQRVQKAWSAVLGVWRCQDPSDRDEYATQLSVLIGDGAFWRGEIPLPLSQR